MKLFLYSVAFFVLVTAVPAIGWAQSAGEAESLIEKGEYEKAVEFLKGLSEAEPRNAQYHRLLGDALRKSGRLDEAIAEYAISVSLGVDPEAYKGMGTAYKWKGEYSKAAYHYGKALEISPSDAEAKEDLESLNSRRGLAIKFMAGGWEADNTTEKYEAEGVYKGFDKLILSLGGSYSKSEYYNRYKYYGNAYYYYNPKSYLRVSASLKDYDYPTGPTLQPDANAYDKVPSIEFEVSHWITDKFRGTVAYEYFRPSFLFDPDSHANNHKLSAEGYYLTPVDWLRVKALLATLRDPDSNRSVIKGKPDSSPAASTEIEYQSQSLIGGGVEVVKDRWSAELKYIPNRDLDHSYSKSIIAGAEYSFTDRVTGRLDYVFDKYSNRSYNRGKSAYIYLASVFYKLNGATDLGLGLKHIDLPDSEDNAGFLTVSYKTGFVF